METCRRSICRSIVCAQVNCDVMSQIIAINWLPVNIYSSVASSNFIVGDFKILLPFCVGSGSSMVTSFMNRV